MSIIGATNLGGNKLAVSVDADPRRESVDVPAGSLISYRNCWFRKLDDGETTNVRLLIDDTEILVSKNTGQALVNKAGNTLISG